MNKNLILRIFRKMTDGINFAVFALVILYSTEAQAQNVENPAKSIQQSETSTAARPTTSPARPQTVAPRVRGLTWSVTTNRTPTRGGIIHGTMGFSGLPRLSYHHVIQPNLSVGGLASFDYGHNNPSGSFEGGLLLGVPVKYRRSLGNFDLGLSGILGIRFPGPKARDAAILIEAEANVGKVIFHRFIVGGGVTVPLWMGFGNRDLVFDVPLLLGPFVEFHVTPPLALTFEAKAGPYLTTQTARETSLGLRASMGIAYRL
ncbi:MAG: hypothetical protein VYC39_12135 [Myxococcota bacterium]|nr:hypothetical protein [Myxococcota bacterium]